MIMFAVNYKLNILVAHGCVGKGEAVLGLAR